MPVKSYYGGSGVKVMARMKKTYGPKKGKRVFYATANKQKSSVSLQGLKAAAK